MFCITMCCKYLFPCLKFNKEYTNEEDINYVYDTDTDTDTTIDIQREDNTWNWSTSNPMLKEKLIASDKDIIFKHIK